ncbi:uncharacterized protein [Chelonus insularis]|uniref:uncharacterized protein isoform X10 n=1 Tax=Chelonus insularis TaxID=460826 RepID=UPI00158969F3|nr:uncharacterized protein LOC118068102 isoform X10 [Chelonus insularis]
MAMVNMNNLLNGKDSRWLQLEVCREFQRNKCTRPDTECKFAHPPANVEVQNGRVTACYDSIKGRCNREKPPCKYFHPPQHLKDQLLINGRNHLALKNALMQQMGLTPGQALVPGQVPTVEGQPPPSSTHHHLQQQIQQQLLATHAFMHFFVSQATNPYLTGMPQVNNTYTPYFTPSPIMPAIMGPADPTGVGSPLGVVPQTVAMPQKLARTDRLEAFPGMVPYKRPAGDKSGMPVYQATGATTYQQLMQLPQPFVPVSCEYAGTPSLPQTSNQTVTNTQNLIVSQASVNTTTETNGILVDPNNPPPPPTNNSSGGGNGGGSNDAKKILSNHEIENAHNSPELNHTSSPQVSQLTAHPVSTATMSSMANLTSVPNVTNLCSMANMTSMANMSSMASIANMHQVNSMANYTMANMANLNVLNTLGMAPSFASMDPAILAKEVAQKNYAKAIKLSQTSQQYGINPLSALNYTGVTLNKQALSMSPQSAAAVAAAAAAAAASSNAPRQMLPPGLAGIPAGTALASTLPASLLHYPRPPSATTTINPYSLIRQHTILPSPYVQASLSGMQNATTIQQATNPYMQNPYAMLPGMAAAAAIHGVAGMSGVTPGVPGIPQLQTANQATIATQPQVAIPVSTGVIMQPYKKMKTT